MTRAATRATPRALVLVLAGSALLAGCAAQECNPNAAGFLSGIGCAASGAYGQRTAYQQQALGSASSQALEARAAAVEQGDRAANSQAAAAAAARRLRQMDGPIADLRARLAAAQRRDGVDRARLEQARAGLAGLEQERAAAGRAPSEERVQELQRRQRGVAALAAAL